MRSRPPNPLPGLSFVVFASLALVAGARSEDVTTLSGMTLHEIHVVRVEPDGVTWQHATGMIKVDFTDLPDRVCRAFHYDPARAAAFQRSLAEARLPATAGEQSAHGRADAPRPANVEVQRTTNPASAPGIVRASFVFHPPSGSGAMTAATRSLGEQIATKNAPLAPHDKEGVTDAQVLHDLQKMGGGLRVTPRSLDSTRDPFFTPDYSGRGYYEDVERAEAFARGRP